MSVHGGVVRDDRAWPRWAGVFSILMMLGAVVALLWAVATASQGPAGVVVVAGAALVSLGVSLWLFRTAFAAVIGGGRQPGWVVVVQLGIVLAGFAAMTYDAHLGTALLAALFGAMFAVNLWAMRRARGNRAVVDAAEDEAEQRRAQDRTGAAQRARVRDSGPALDVGGMLDAAWRDVWQRWVAWLVAGAAVTAVTVIVTDSELAVVMVLTFTVLTVLWVSRAAWSVGLGRRDFRLARTAPERAWVVLLDDPTPRMIRPLLGVWSEEPVVREGVFPQPELVFRCDDELDDLLSHQGGVEVHEAWVDTSGRGMRGARWVAADEGVALPHRRAVLGRRYFHAFTRAERPGSPVPLSSARPDPAAPRDGSAPTPAGPALVTRLLWRAGALAALAGASVLID